MARILLIDDDDSLRTFLSLALAEHGHTVIEAHNGEVGLKAFAEVKPDLVITDLVMPEKSGLEVLTELQTKTPPVKAIAMSGGRRHGAGDDLETARSLGAARVLSKPFSFDALIAAIRELLPEDGVGSRTTAGS